MTRLALALAVVVLATGLPGCGGRDRAAPPPGPGGPVVFERDGGLTPESVRMVLRPDGRGTIVVAGGTAGGRFPLRVPAARARAVRRALDDAGFTALPARRRDFPPAPDARRYAISYRGHRVALEQGSLPPGMERAVALLDAVAGRAKADAL